MNALYTTTSLDEELASDARGGAAAAVAATAAEMVWLGLPPESGLDLTLMDKDLS